MHDHGDEIEADLQRYYGLDLLDLYRGRLSLRKVGVLIAHLPLGSATVAALSGAAEGWVMGDYLLADVFNATAGQPHPARPQIVDSIKLDKMRQQLLVQARGAVKHDG